MLAFSLAQKHSRRRLLLPAYFLHRGDAQSVPTGGFLREHLHVSHCSEAAHWHFSPVLSAGSGWIAFCYTWPERLKIVESNSWYITILPGFWKSAWLCKMLKCCVSLGIALTSLIRLVMGVGFFRPYNLAKAPNLGAQTLVNAKSKRTQVLMFWWGDGHWFDRYLCLSLQPPQLSDAVISMVTQTPRLSTAACEEQHSAAQRSHDQVSQKESPNKSWPPVCHFLSYQVFPWDISQAVRSCAHTWWWTCTSVVT